MSQEDEELRRQLEEQLENIRVEDVLVQTIITLVNLGARRLDGGQNDQAQMAIEGVRALLPLCPEDVQSALREPLSQLQLGFARAARGESPEAKPDAPKPESKLWTPGG